MSLGAADGRSLAHRLHLAAAFAVLVVAAIITVVAGGGDVRRASAAASSTPREAWGSAAGWATAIVPVGETAYLGGPFSYLGPYTGAGVAAAVSTGKLVPGWPAVDGVAPVSVDAAVSDGDGGWYIGGYFTTVGGEARSHLAHIQADGTLDPGFDPGVTGETVSALAVSGGTL